MISCMTLHAHTTQHNSTQPVSEIHIGQHPYPHTYIPVNVTCVTQVIKLSRPNEINLVPCIIVGGEAIKKRD